MNPSTKRVWLIADGEVNTIKGHCKRLGINYSALQSRIRKKEHIKLSDASDATLSYYLGVPVKRTSQPKNWEDIMYGEGMNALGPRRDVEYLNPPRPIVLKAG